RIFAYADAQRYRLGAHYESLPVNRPLSPVHTYHKDGGVNFRANNPNPDAYYEPNSFSGPKEAPQYREPPLRTSGDADRYNHREGNDDYGLPRALFELFDAAQKGRLFANLAAAMQGVPDFILERQFAHFDAIHPDYGSGVRAAVEAGRRKAGEEPTALPMHLEVAARLEAAK